VAVGWRLVPGVTVKANWGVPATAGVAAAAEGDRPLDHRPRRRGGVSSNPNYYLRLRNSVRVEYTPSNGPRVRCNVLAACLCKRKFR